MQGLRARTHARAHARAPRPADPSAALGEGARTIGVHGQVARARLVERQPGLAPLDALATAVRTPPRRPLVLVLVRVRVLVLVRVLVVAPV